MGAETREILVWGKHMAHVEEGLIIWGGGCRQHSGR